MVRGYSKTSVALVLCVMACGGQDPILDRAEEIRDQGGPEATRNPGPSAGSARGGSSSGSVGGADSPPPGNPDPPPPGAPEQPSPGVPDDANRTPPPIQGEGSQATITGTISIPEGMSGTINLKAFVSQPMDGQGHPNLAGPDVKIVASGTSTEFEMTVKNGDQPVWLEAHLDIGDQIDGRPGPGEPFGRGSEGIPTTEDTAGVELVLVVREHRDHQSPDESLPPRP